MIQIPLLDRDKRSKGEREKKKRKEQIIGIQIPISVPNLSLTIHRDVIIKSINMKMWKIDTKENEYYREHQVRRGLRLRFDQQVNSEVRRACVEFGAWLRKNYEFPIRVVVYIRSTEKIRAKDGEQVSATIWEPIDPLEEPYIRISTGEYLSEAGSLHSISHELTHYYQWIHRMDNSNSDRLTEWQASYYATMVIRQYASTREHP